MVKFLPAGVACASLVLTFALAAVLAQAQAISKSCVGPEHRQFDFWLGSWNVADPSGKPQGTNDVTLIQDGCVLQEHWKGVDGSSGTSFNLYDASAKHWHQTWVDNSGGILLLDGGLSNGAMILTQARTLRDGSSAIDRITWTKLGAGKVRQLWDRSKDNGKHWKIVFDGIYTLKG
ncbi:MAG: hypothetical protein M3007_02335 [Candidatus Eremiobacteraeota bacterium]|nr:hypothetical protein [Candidatus Eremiobacteraeota bacterium]